MGHAVFAVDVGGDDDDEVAAAVADDDDTDGRSCRSVILTLVVVHLCRPSSAGRF